jgi:hypothetical protein
MVTETQLEYVVDEKGRKTKVILPIEIYEELLEDLHDLSVAFERRDEARLPWEELKQELEDGSS